MKSKITMVILFLILYGCSPERMNQNFKTSHLSEQNPWSHLNFNIDSQTFQFAIVGDRTGGMRPGIFNAAMEKINLLQPEFVISVGDLVTGWDLEKNELITDSLKIVPISGYTVLIRQ